MTQVTVDAEMRAKLNGLSGPLVFCDERGHVLGRFEPQVADDKQNWEPAFSTAELNAMDQETGGRSLREILSDLRSRR